MGGIEMNIVKELRKRAGIQQKELAIEIGVAQPTVSEWEKNKKDPSGERLKKLAEYFNVDELVILGKGVVDLKDNPDIPKTTEAKILAANVDKLTEENRKRAVALFDVFFNMKYDAKKDDDNDTEL